jgi:hypothetical protein
VTRSRIPAVPPVPASASPDVQAFLNTVRSVLENITGPNTEFATKTDVEVIVDGKVPSILDQAQNLPSGGAGTGTGTGGGSAPPPPLAGLRVTAGFAYVMLEWDTIPYGNSAYTIIYRATVDDFTLAEPIGTSRFLLYSDYVPNFQEYFYWITSVSNNGTEGPPNSQRGTKSASAIDTQFVLDQIEKALTQDQIANGGLGSEEIFGSAVIGTAAIKNAAIIDAHIQSLGADKIVTNSLSAINANLGQVTAGRMQSPDGTFLIDLSGKQILISGPDGQTRDTYTIIENGRIQTWYWDGTQHSLALSLTHIEVGVAANDTYVQIPGTFLTAPRVMVSPASMKSYLAAYAAQDQTLKCMALDLREVTPGSRRWQFKAVAQLELGAASVTTPVNSYPPPESSNVITTPEYTTPDSTASVAFRLRARSTRGTGGAPNYYARRVAFNVFARPAGSTGAYVQYYSGPYIALPKDVDSNNTLFISFSMSFPVADAWQFYITATYADTGEVFNAGGASEETAVDTLTAQNVSKTIDKATNPDSGVADSGTLTEVVKAALPDYLPPAGWTVSQAVYKYKYYGFVQLSGWITGYTGTAKTMTLLPTRSVSNLNTQSGSTTPTLAPQHTLAYYDKDALAGSLQVSWNRPLYGGSQMRLQAKGGFEEISVDITRRRPLANSTTPQNTLHFSDYTSTISGSVILADGTLNWQAVG